MNIFGQSLEKVSGSGAAAAVTATNGIITAVTASPGAAGSGYSANATAVSGTISGNVFTVTAATGSIIVGMGFTTTGGAATGTRITGYLTGFGGVGTYTVNISQTATVSNAVLAQIVTVASGNGDALISIATVSGSGVATFNTTPFYGGTGDTVPELLLVCRLSTHRCKLPDN
jgi:hypothetical protein